MDESRKQTQKNGRFHLQKAQEQEKLSYCDRYQMGAYLQGDVAGKRRGSYVLDLNLGYGFMGLCVDLKIIELYF